MCRKELQPLLRPAQPTVGYAWVQTVAHFAFPDAAAAQAKLDEEPLPVARGVGPHVYLIDHHHTLSALDLSGHEP